MGDSGKAALGLVGLVLVAAWIVAVFAGGGRPTDERGPAVSPTSAPAPTAAPAPVAEPRVQDRLGYDSYIVTRTKDGVRARLRDPASATFINVHVGMVQGAKVVCGYVNSNNALGGKVGPQRFIGLGETVFLEEEGAQAVNDVWTQGC